MEELSVDLEQSNLQQKYNDLLKKLDALNTELAQAKECIKQYESQESDKNNLLELIFDSSDNDRYSPDLVLSIKLWEHIYILNPKKDSHSNKADTWLKVNTGYDVAKKAGSASKIREITTPFVNWSPHRDKKFKK